MDSTQTNWLLPQPIDKRIDHPKKGQLHVEKNRSGKINKSHQSQP